MEQSVFDEQFIIHKKIASGSFGEIYSGENIKTHRRVAIKVEKKDCRIPQLCCESKVYLIMQGGPGIASYYWYGSNDRYNALVIDRLGNSLETLFKQCNSHFTLKTVLMLADQMLTCIEYFHNKNYIHRDIKPDNFVMGRGSKLNQVFLIDFGLGKKYRDICTHKHIEYSSNNFISGTARYSSVNALKGVEQSRRDDLEALGYVFLYFLRGNLPWMIKRNHESGVNYMLINKIKEKTKFEDLCDGFPDEFIQYFYLVRNLQFAEKPNYSFYRKIFRDLFIKSGFIYDFQYDWVTSCNANVKKAKSQNNVVMKQNIQPNITLKRQYSHPKIEEKIIKSSKNFLQITKNSVDTRQKILTINSIDSPQLIENPDFQRKNIDQSNQHQKKNNINKKFKQKHPIKLEKNIEYNGKPKNKTDKLTKK